MVLLAGFLLRVLFHPEGGGNTFPLKWLDLYGAIYSP